MNDGWHDDSWGIGAWIAMGFMMIVFWGLIAALVVYVIRNVGHRPHVPSDLASQDQAVRILDERFAKGEIDADEYTTRRDLLSRRP